MQKIERIISSTLKGFAATLSSYCPRDFQNRRLSEVQFQSALKETLDEKEKGV